MSFSVKLQLYNLELGPEVTVNAADCEVAVFSMKTLFSIESLLEPPIDTAPDSTAVLLTNLHSSMVNDGLPLFKKIAPAIFASFLEKLEFDMLILPP